MKMEVKGSHEIPRKPGEHIRCERQETRLSIDLATCREKGEELSMIVDPMLMTYTESAAGDTRLSPSAHMYEVAAENLVIYGVA